MAVSWIHLESKNVGNVNSCLANRLDYVVSKYSTSRYWRENIRRDYSFCWKFISKSVIDRIFFTESPYGVKSHCGKTLHTVHIFSCCANFPYSKIFHSVSSSIRCKLPYLWIAYIFSNPPYCKSPHMVKVSIWSNTPYGHKLPHMLALSPYGA